MVLTLLILLVVSLGVFKSSNETDEEIRAKLRCHRVTADYLITDYNCDHLADYRRYCRNNDLLKNEWGLEYGE